MTSEHTEQPGGYVASHEGVAVPDDETTAADHAGHDDEIGPDDTDDQGPGLRAALEAIMLVADEPVAEVLLAQVLERPRGEVAATLRELSAQYTADGRGFDLREAAGGWRL